MWTPKTEVLNKCLHKWSLTNYIDNPYLVNKFVIFNSKIPSWLLKLQGYGFVIMVLKLNPATESSPRQSTESKSLCRDLVYKTRESWEQDSLKPEGQWFCFLCLGRRKPWRREDNTGLQRHSSWGAPAWLSWLSRQLLTSARVINTESWDRARCPALCSAGHLLEDWFYLSSSPNALPPTHMDTCSLFNK